jgi:hypothetical protein
VYTGLFKVYDNRSNVEDLNKQAENLSLSNPNIILDPNQGKETAVVTRKLVNEQAQLQLNQKK